MRGIKTIGYIYQYVIMKIRREQNTPSQQYMSQIQSGVVSTQLIVMTSLLRDVRRIMGHFVGISIYTHDQSATEEMNLIIIVFISSTS